MRREKVPYFTIEANREYFKKLGYSEEQIDQMSDFESFPTEAPLLRGKKGEVAYIKKKQGGRYTIIYELDPTLSLEARKEWIETTGSFFKRRLFDQEIRGPFRSFRDALLNGTKSFVKITERPFRQRIIEEFDPDSKDEASSAIFLIRSKEYEITSRNEETGWHSKRTDVRVNFDSKDQGREYFDHDRLLQETIPEYSQKERAIAICHYYFKWGRVKIHKRSRPHIPEYQIKKFIDSQGEATFSLDMTAKPQGLL